MFAQRILKTLAQKIVRLYLVYNSVGFSGSVMLPKLAFQIR